MGGFIQTPRDKKEIAEDEYTKSTIPRHESHSVQWVVCLISSGVLAPSRCHNLALFKVPGVPRAGRLATDIRLWTLFGITTASRFSPCQKALFRLISISKAEGVCHLREQLPNKGPFSASFFGEKWTWEYKTHLGPCPLIALKPRRHAERINSGGRDGV